MIQEVQLSILTVVIINKNNRIHFDGFYCKVTYKVFTKMSASIH